MQPILEITFTNVVMATALALVAAFAGKVCRRPVLTHFLWLLVLLKLVTPPLVPVRLGLPAFLEEALAGADPGHNAAQANAPATRMPPASAAFESGGEQGNEPLLDENFILPELVQTNPYRADLAQAGTEDAPAMPATAWSSADTLPWLGVLWIGGTLCWIGLAVKRIYGFQCSLRHARPACAYLQQQAAELAKNMGLPRCPEVCVVPGRVSPLLWALGGRVRLVLPSELLRRLQPEQQVTLLAHELAHARRRDHWVRWLEFLVTSLYWWLPTTWWARRQLQEAEEECCDAWVVWMLPAAAKAYAKALLQTVDFLDARPALPPTASGLGHLYFLKRRLTMIVHERLSPRLPWPIQVGTILMGLLVLPIAPQRLAADTPTTAPTILSVQDEDDPPARGQQNQLRELERRMNRLEERLDRALRALEMRSERRGRTEETDKGKDMSRADREKSVAEALKRAAEARKRGDEERKRGLEEAMRARSRTLSEWKRMDPERMKDLEKQIQDTVNKTFSPERMKDLQKQIQSIVEKNVNPEKMKDLDKQIQALVERTVNPERMQQLQRQIESIIARNMPAEQRERSARPELPRTPEPPSQPRRPERPRSATAPDQPSMPPRGAGAGFGAGAGRSANQRDLERRIDKLEAKMDRLLQALESKEKDKK
ncbi:MAG TPA: M56 family metallopeptidase [Gemmataceae bacterium]|jgi:beta-lactamase regulating signal transducer with metallopeptidase domain|nr:M56 family metallopeptidase [Gemmataceae bacterium]